MVKGSLWSRALLFACTALLVGNAAPSFTGDAFDYARDAAEADTPKAPDLYEPGHLIWRPIGALLVRVGASTPDETATTRQRRAQRLLSFAASLAAAVAILSFHGVVAQFVGTGGPALVATLAFGSGAAFLNFAAAGTPYVPGLAALCLALLVGWGPLITMRHAVATGALLALSTFLWLPYVFVVPAALAGMVAFGGSGRSTKVYALTALATCAAFGLGVFSFAALRAGAATPRDAAQWLLSSSHGVTLSGGSRAAGGFVRNMLYVGSDTREVKRFLLHDDLNPVSRRQLARLFLWPKALFLLGSLVTAIWFALRKPAGRRLLLICVLAAMPVCAFAIAWSGGDPERYLPLYPFLMLLLVVGLDAALRAGSGWLRGMALLVACIWAGNIWSFSRHARQERVSDQLQRLGCVAGMLDAQSLILLPHQADPLVGFYRDEPDVPPRSADASLIWLLPTQPWSDPAYTWQTALRDSVTSRLSRGDRIFVPRYSIETVPPLEANWIEGEYAGTRWRDVSEAFRGHVMREPCENRGDFLELAAMEAGS